MDNKKIKVAMVTNHFEITGINDELLQGIRQE